MSCVGPGERDALSVLPETPEMYAEPPDRTFYGPKTTLPSPEPVEPLTMPPEDTVSVAAADTVGQNSTVPSTVSRRRLTGEVARRPASENVFRRRCKWSHDPRRRCDDTLTMPPEIAVPDPGRP